MNCVELGHVLTSHPNRPRRPRGPPAGPVLSEAHGRKIFRPAKDHRPKLPSVCRLVQHFDVITGQIQKIPPSPAPCLCTPSSPFYSHLISSWRSSCTMAHHHQINRRHVSQGFAAITRRPFSTYVTCTSSRAEMWARFSSSSVVVSFRTCSSNSCTRASLRLSCWTCPTSAA